MSKKTKVWILVINIILSLIIISGLVLLLKEMDLTYKIVYCVFTIFLLIINILFIIFNKIKLFKITFVINIFLFVMFWILYIFNITGDLSDLESIKNIIKNSILESGIYGLIVTFFIHLLQVVILPAPSWIFVLATTSIYGALKGFIISSLGAIIGSYICFALGRFGGKRAVSFCIGEEKTKEYSDFLNKKGKVPFIIMQLLPFFPDDIMCMIAGISSMSFRFFSIVILIVRPIVIGTICLFGSDGLASKIIPFSGFGIVIWILIISLIVLGCYYYYKNQDKVDNYFTKIFFRNKTK